MGGVFIVFVVNCLASMIYSTPFMLLDQDNEANSVDNSLYFSPVDQTTGDELVLNSIVGGSVIESPFEDEPTIWQDYSDPKLDTSLQLSGTYFATDIIATSPSKFSLQHDDKAII